METSNFNLQATERSVLDGISGCFNNPKSFPDIQISGDGNNVNWLCHKMILAKRSDHFMKLFSGPWKENGAKDITFFEDDPHALEEALRYCYTQEIDYDNTLAMEEGTSRALFYVRVFGVGEKYFIKDLPRLAADRLVETINSSDPPKLDELAEAFEEAYTKTTDSVRLLRDPIIRKVLDNADDFLGGEKTCFNNLAETCKEFNRDVLRALAKAHPKIVPGNTLYECPTGGCRHKLRYEAAVIEDNGDLSFECPRRHCTYTMSVVDWRAFAFGPDGEAPGSRTQTPASPTQSVNLGDW